MRDDHRAIFYSYDQGSPRWVFISPQLTGAFSPIYTLLIKFLIESMIEGHAAKRPHNMQPAIAY